MLLLHIMRVRDVRLGKQVRRAQWWKGFLADIRTSSETVRMSQSWLSTMSLAEHPQTRDYWQITTHVRSVQRYIDLT